MILKMNSHSWNNFCWQKQVAFQSQCWKMNYMITFDAVWHIAMTKQTFVWKGEYEQSTVFCSSKNFVYEEES